MPLKKEIMFPMFLECCSYTKDIFWESIFEDLAYGKLPYGTYISNNSLCCSYKDKNFTYKIEEKDPKELYNDVYNILSKKLSMVSQKDNIKKKIEFYNSETDMLDYPSWSSIRKKNIQDFLIEDYIIRMRKKHNLNLLQARYLLSVIYIARTLKIISSKDIILEDGIIDSINYISFDKRKIFFEKDMYSTSTEISTPIIIEKHRISDGWQKYLDNLRKLESCN